MAVASVQVRRSVALNVACVDGGGTGTGNVVIVVHCTNNEQQQIGPRCIISLSISLCRAMLNNVKKMCTSPNFLS